MKTPQWLVDFYHKWWAAVTPPDPDLKPYVGEEIPRYTALDRDYLYSKEYDALIRSQLPPPLTKTGPIKRQPIKARKALKTAKAKKKK